MSVVTATRYKSIGRFTPTGEARFRAVMNGKFPDENLDLVSERFAEEVPGTRELKIGKFKTSKDMALAVTDAFEGGYSPEMYNWNGMWNWLSFVLRDQIWPHDEDGVRSKMAEARWFARKSGKWDHEYRNMVRMSVFLYDSFGDDADHLLCSGPDIFTVPREYLTSWSGMMQPVLQKVARRLYFSDLTGGLKEGSSGRGPGIPNRFRKVVLQLDVTYDLSDISFEGLIEILPKEFDRFLDASV